MIDGPQFIDLYRALATSSFEDLAAGQAAACETTYPGVFVSRDSMGAAALIIETAEPGSTQLPSYNLRGVNAQFGVTVDLLVAGSWRKTTCAVVRCLQAQEVSIRFFFSICESMARSVVDLRVIDTLAEAIDRVVSIFSRLSGPGRREITGLAGELLFITLHEMPVVAVSAWRSSPHDRFDFVFHDYRVDVKATATRSRTHAVTYEQTNPPGESVAFFASLFIEEISVGETGEELVARVLLACAGDVAAQLKVQEVIAESLGDNLPDFLTFTFDADLANSSIRFYDARLVPALRQSLPDGVGRVKFSSDFNLAPLTELPTPDNG